MGPRRRGGPHLTSDVIYEREGGRDAGEPSTVAGVGGIDGSFSFSLLLSYIVSEARGRLYKNY